MRHSFVALPRSYVLLSFGNRLLVKSATIVILSVSALPTVIVPPIVTLPPTSKLPATTVSAFKFSGSLPFGSMLMGPVLLLNVLPASTKLPVCTAVGLTMVTLVPSVNVIPVKLEISKLGAAKLTAPVSKFTLNKSPTRKLPTWSTLL